MAGEPRVWDHKQMARKTKKVGLPTSKTVVRVGMVAQERVKAWQLGVDGELYWVPKSLMVWPQGMKEGDEDVDVEIETWLCVKEGIET